MESALIAAALWYLVPMLFGSQGMGSTTKYADVARTAFAFTESPWGYRVLVPWLARGLSDLLPIGLERAFEMIQFVAYLACTALLVHAGTVVRVSRAMILLGVLGWTIGYQFVYMRHNYVHVGLVELAMVGWLCWMVYRYRFLPLLALLSLSVPVKETIAFVMVPLICFHWLIETVRYRRPPFAAWQLLALVTVPAVLFLALRAFYGPGLVAPGTGYLGFYRAEFFADVFGPELLWRVVQFLTTFGVLLVLMPIAFVHARNDRLLRLCLLVPPAALTQLVITLDPRLMASLATLSVFVMGLRLAGEHGERRLVRNALLLNLVFCAGWLSQTYPIAIAALGVGTVMFLMRFATGLRLPATDA